MLNLPDQLEWLVNHEVVMLFIHFHHTWKSCHSIKGVPTPLQLKVLITAPIAVETDAWNIVNLTCVLKVLAPLRKPMLGMFLMCMD